MCGIAGTFRYEGPPFPGIAAEVARTREAMFSRGPDGWANGFPPTARRHSDIAAWRSSI